MRMSIYIYRYRYIVWILFIHTYVYNNNSLHFVNIQVSPSKHEVKTKFPTKKRRKNDLINDIGINLQSKLLRYRTSSQYFSTTKLSICSFNVRWHHKIVFITLLIYKSIQLSWVKRRAKNEEFASKARLPSAQVLWKSPKLRNHNFIWISIAIWRINQFGRSI